MPGMPPASRACAPPSTGKAFGLYILAKCVLPSVSRSLFHEWKDFSRFCTCQSLLPRRRCRACEADEVSPGGKPCGVWICGGPMRCTSEQRINEFRTQFLKIETLASNNEKRTKKRSDFRMVIFESRCVCFCILWQM